VALLSREALYELVWAEPVRAVAENYGLSDVGLRRICARAEIPVPERGYWAKLRAGKPATRLKLPARGPAMPHLVAVGEQPSHFHWGRDPEAELAEPPPDEPVFAEPIEEVRARVASRVGRVRFERNLTAAHILIRDLLAQDEKRRPKRGEPSWMSGYSQPLFDSGFERHRLRILSSLFLAVQRMGARPWLNGETARDIGLSVGVETVRFTLDHPDAKADRNGQWKTRPGTIDTMCLSVHGAGARTWLDTEADRLEARLDEVVVHLIVAGELNYRAQALASYERAMNRRREAREELERARAEAVRRARERRIAEERDRRNALLGMAADLRAADDIRALVHRVSAIRAETSTDSVGLWRRWALEVADRIDPTPRLHFDDAGHAELREPEWPDLDGPTPPGGAPSPPE